MEAARTSETSVDNYFRRQYIPEGKSEPNGYSTFLHLQAHTELTVQKANMDRGRCYTV
jgi:hypothetical protein